MGNTSSQAFAAPSSPQKFIAKIGGASGNSTGISCTIAMDINSNWMASYGAEGSITVSWRNMRQDSLVKPPAEEQDLEFIQQKSAFEKRAAEEPLFLAPFRGKFVASVDGQVLDSDIDLHSLTERFFTRYGDVAVYIGRVGGKRKVYIDSPNRVR